MELVVFGRQTAVSGSDSMRPREELRAPRRAALGMAGQMSRAVTRLRQSKDVDDLLQKTGPVVQALGFTRIGIGFLEGSTWSLRKTFIADSPGLAERVTTMSQRSPHELLPRGFETEVVNRMHGVLVHNVESYIERTDRRIVHALDATSGAAAPLISGETVVGTIHADLSETPASQLLERARALCDFAAVYGVVLENVMLTSAIAEFHRQLGAGLFAGVRAKSPHPAGAGIREELSRREFDVLELMSLGYTNDRIGQELGIATGTVKSHVKGILRKLQVDNRASAVARYTRQRT